MRMQAVFNDHVIADSEDTVVVEGYHYFPESSLRQELFTRSEARSLCRWKGIAFYSSIDVDGVHGEDVAWTYPKPRRPARRIKGRYAFWRGVEVRPREG
ncbi:MAG: DUF427 domain-containing protein [Nocardioidaceae bacterium]|nr:DUF427 domain-containing protein [Nocardioidaceae bacterium]